MKQLTKWILWIFGIAACVILFNSVFSSKESLTVIQIKESEKMHFTNQYDKDALLMIPAAYTNEDGTIQGEYRIDGKTYGTPSRKERISLHPTRGIVISGSWHSQDMLHRSESRYGQLRIWLVWQNEIQQVGILQQGKADKLDLCKVKLRLV